MSKSPVLAALLAGLATPGIAQELPDLSPDIAGVTINHDMFSDMQRMMMQFGTAQRDIDNCWKLGCVLIVNETKNFDVVGFYVDSAKAGAPADWSRNQFGAPLRPMKVTLRFKTGGNDACAIPVRFVLRDRATKAMIETTGTANLCSTPHQDTLLRIKAPRPTVTVEGG